MNKKGFTLVEMLVVIAIIAVLVAIIVPTAAGAAEKAAASTNAANLRSYASQMAIYKLTGDATAIPTAPKAKACKDCSADAVAVVYEDGGQAVAYFKDGDSEFYGVDFFTAISEGKAGTVTTSPAGTQITTSAVAG